MNKWPFTSEIRIWFVTYSRVVKRILQHQNKVRMYFPILIALISNTINLSHIQQIYNRRHWNTKTNILNTYKNESLIFKKEMKTLWQMEKLLNNQKSSADLSSENIRLTSDENLYWIICFEWILFIIPFCQMQYQFCFEWIIEY